MEVNVANPRRTTPERMAAFSDGVFAVIITVMVLELKPPHQFTFRALAQLWPMLLSYAVSYLFIAIVWVNHHHLLRFAEEATPGLIWWNFVHLFLVSFLPFSTAWVSDSRFSPEPVCAYAVVFVLVDSAYCAFLHETLHQAKKAVMSPRELRAIRLRAFTTLGAFILAAVVALKFPFIGFAMIFAILLAFIRPSLIDE
jgi:uncharacterized membrane protein